MHIAFNAWFWNQKHTGSGQYLRQLVYHLNRLVTDLDITLIHPAFETLTDVPPSVKTEAVASRGGNVGKVIFEQRGFPQAVSRIKPDIAHVPYWGSPLSCSVPVVVTIHDMTTEQVREYRRGAMQRGYNALVGASARGASHIIADSYSSKLDVMDILGIPEDDVTAIYLGIDTKIYTPEEDFLIEMAVRQEYDLPDFFVLYLGGFTIHKNVPNLLLAYTYVSTALGDQYPLLLAGKKPTKVSETFPDYDKLIKEMNLEDSVRWLGFVEESHKPVLYRAADTFIFPSRAEGFGFPPLEAMACGTPVVTTNAGSLPEVIGDAGFTVDPDDVRDMGGAIIATLVQDNLRHDLKTRGLEQAKSFTWEATAHETLLVYDEVLS